MPADKLQPGLVEHTTGWPLDDKTGGGSFMYHFGDNYVSIGLVVHLNYKNPWLSPFDEFQRFKHHPAVKPHLEGGKRIAYGARAITEGGYQSVPKLTFPGGALIGCSAGFVNVPRIKGSHNAVKTGMLAAEAAFEAIGAGRASDELTAYQDLYEKSWVAKELKVVRNAKPLLGKLGTFLGGAAGMFDMWCTHLLGGFSFFGTLKHAHTDAASTGLAKDYKPLVYPKPDGVISFDKLELGVHLGHQPRGRPAGPPDAEGSVDPDRGEPAQVRRTGAALLPGGRLRGALQRAGPGPALPDQRPELRPLQNL